MPSRAEQSRLLVKIRQATRRGYIECEVPGVADLNFENSEHRRGRVQGGGQISPTLATSNQPDVIENGDERLSHFMYEVDGEEYMIRIRKLTPKECWRLMDFSDQDFEKAEKVCSNSQLYRQAGNSIVRNVLVAIFGQLFEGKENEYKTI